MRAKRDIVSCGMRTPHEQQPRHTHTSPPSSKEEGSTGISSYDRRTGLLLGEREGLPVLPLELFKLLVHGSLLGGAERRPLRLYVGERDRAGGRCHVGRAGTSVGRVRRGCCESATHEAECRGVHGACRVDELVREIVD